jgi:hypothetical protein
MKLSSSSSYVWSGRVLVGPTRIGVAGMGNVYSCDLFAIRKNGSKGEPGSYFELLLQVCPDGPLEVWVPRERQK